MISFDIYIPFVKNVNSYKIFFFIKYIKFKKLLKFLEKIEKSLTDKFFVKKNKIILMMFLDISFKLKNLTVLVFRLITVKLIHY